MHRFVAHGGKRRAEYPIAESLTKAVADDSRYQIPNPIEAR
jgi:hypothetical protein